MSTSNKFICMISKGQKIIYFFKRRGAFLSLTLSSSFLYFPVKKVYLLLRKRMNANLSINTALDQRASFQAHLPTVQLEDAVDLGAICGDN